jgi:hypothetical protein
LIVTATIENIIEDKSTNHIKQAVFGFLAAVLNYNGSSDGQHNNVLPNARKRKNQKDGYTY